jgi:hypothetical protein
VQSTGPLHDAHGAVCLALLAVGFVLCRIPGVRQLTGVVVQRQIEDVAFLRADAEAPFIDDERYPVPGDVNRSGGLRRGRLGGWTITATALASLRGSEANQADAYYDDR